MPSWGAKKEGGTPQPYRRPSTAGHCSHLPLPCKPLQSPEADLSHQDRASLSNSVPFIRLPQQGISTLCPTVGWRVSTWDCCGEKGTCHCLLSSQSHEGHLYRCIYQSCPHPPAHKHKEESSRREQGSTIQDCATEGGGG